MGCSEVAMRYLSSSAPTTCVNRQISQVGKKWRIRGGGDNDELEANGLEGVIEMEG